VIGVSERQTLGLELVELELAPDVNVIIGQSHFIKTAEDIYDALSSSVPGIRFGLAFCESSGPRLVRVEGTDDDLKQLASRNALRVGAGHSFIVFLKGTYPINVLNALKNVPEICNIYCASANPIQVILAKTDQGRGILGVIDGGSPVGVEGEKEVRERRAFLRKIGYKL
jgi:uncharacterized protein